MSMSNVFQIAGSALTAQSMRLNAVASNLANADSAHASTGEAYKAKQVVASRTEKITDVEIKKKIIFSKS